MRTQKGITLVALIITVVVLLILATVAITAIGETNIINYANNAATNFDAAQKNEEKEIQNYEQFLKDNS